MSRLVTSSIRDPPRALLIVTLALAAAHGCRVEREGVDSAYHPSGYEDATVPGYHGADLRARGFPLAECRECHGGAYEGGPVGPSCSEGGCHAEGVEACSTCHAAEPLTEAHPKHAGSCDGCHPVRHDARSTTHPGGAVEVILSGLAAHGGATPSYAGATGTCAGTYCHGGRSAAWTTPGPLPCAACHDAPPPSHARFAIDPTGCGSCHPGGVSHVDGDIDTGVVACDGCHGKGALGAPPAGLLGSVDGPAVGAHARHLDPNLADRMGRVARCDDCHAVPEQIGAAGHVDAAPPADVSLRAGGAYATDTRTCAVGCHWHRDPGPRWDDNSGAARACDSCHGFPLLKTRAGTAHPPSEPLVSVCVSCHLFDPGTHVDGKVDFSW